MERLIGRICTYCVRNKIIPAEKAPWLAYGLEKRLTTWIAMPPFLLLSVVCIGFWQTVAFFCSFFLLRSRLNGYHADKYIRCFFLSLLTEVFFLLLVYPLINEWSSILLVVLNVVLVFWLAPYNHPNMNLSDEEYIACRTHRLIDNEVACGRPLILVLVDHIVGCLFEKLVHLFFCNIHLSTFLSVVSNAKQNNCHSHT